MKILGIILCILFLGIGTFIGVKISNNQGIINSLVPNAINPILRFAGEPLPLPQGVYEYQYDLLTPTCDTHALKFRIYYECEILSDAITIANPYIYLGFYERLLDTTCLDNLMKNANVCVMPKGTCIAYADITPQGLTANTISKIASKPMYYSNGTRVTLILFDKLTPTSTAQFQDMLKNMWTIQCT